MRRFLPLVAALLVIPTNATEPVRVAIVGLTHDHVFWLLGRDRSLTDIEVVGVCEPNEELAVERMGGAGLPASLRYADLDTMLAEARPEAAVLFGSIREHHDAAIRCAEAGVHLMVEKPLATELAAAQRMAAAAREAGVHLLTNYETTWYPAHAELKRRVAAGELGRVRRMVFRTGHRGPVEIGCRDVFLEWLLDPVENGAGALTDFGCYGINLATWLLDGERPLSVSCVASTLKPDVYKRVDDDATITLEYPSAVAVIQASWNWPHSIKETRVYCERGDLMTIEQGRLRVHTADSPAEEITAPPFANRSDAEPFAHLAAVVRGDAEPNALSSLENNLLVVEVLDAARRSAETGERVRLNPKQP